MSTVGLIENTLNQVLDILDVPLRQIRDEYMESNGYQLDRVFIDDGDVYIVYVNPSTHKELHIFIRPPRDAGGDFFIYTDDGLNSFRTRLLQILDPVLLQFRIRYVRVGVQQEGGYIINPSTGRKVKVNGRIGRKLRRH